RLDDGLAHLDGFVLKRDVEGDRRAGRQREASDALGVIADVGDDEVVGPGREAPDAVAAVEVGGCAGRHPIAPGGKRGHVDADERLARGRVYDDARKRAGLRSGGAGGEEDYEGDEPEPRPEAGEGAPDAPCNHRHTRVGGWEEDAGQGGCERWHGASSDRTAATYPARIAPLLPPNYPIVTVPPPARGARLSLAAFGISLATFDPAGVM